MELPTDYLNLIIIGLQLISLYIGAKAYQFQRVNHYPPEFQMSNIKIQNGRVDFDLENNGPGEAQNVEVRARDLNTAVPVPEKHELDSTERWHPTDSSQSYYYELDYDDSHGIEIIVDDNRPGCQRFTVTQN
jgi:hypothetical protein